MNGLAGLLTFLIVLTLLRPRQAGRFIAKIVIGFRGELNLLDKTERPAPSQDDYGSTKTRDGGQSYSGAKSGDSFGRSSQPSTDHLDDDVSF